MKFFKNSQFSRLGTVAAVLFTGAFFSQVATACVTDNWLGGTSGTLNPAQPDDMSDPAARYSGLCGLEVPGGQVAYVDDNSPGGIDRIRARFYVLVDSTANVFVYRGLNGGGSTVFDVLVNPNTNNVRLSSSGVNLTCAGCANIGSWNSIEIDWDAGSGNMELLVNGAGPAPVAFSSAETVSNVRLGNLNGAAGDLSFDSYESRRTTEIGRLLVADANESGDVTGGDLAVIAGEILGNALATGQPDCNESGDVTGADLSCTSAIILGL